LTCPQICKNRQGAYARKKSAHKNTNEADMDGAGAGGYLVSGNPRPKNQPTQPQVKYIGTHSQLRLISILANYSHRL